MDSRHQSQYQQQDESSRVSVFVIYNEYKIYLNKTIHYSINPNPLFKL